MNDSYKELMVKKERSFLQQLLRIACIVFTVLLGMVTLLTGNIILFIVVVVLGVLDYFIFQWTDIEYEYLYLDKEISVDKILAKTRRKKAAKIEVDKIEILAPESSHQLDSYRNRQVKTMDYSAGHDLPGQKLYAAYYEGSQRFLFNLDDDFVKTVKSVAPRKVFVE